MSRNCTIPKIFGLREWWEGRFGDLCALHDYDYDMKEVSRFEADAYYARGMWGKGYRSLAVVSFAGLTLFGWLYWYGIMK